MSGERQPSEPFKAPSLKPTKVIGNGAFGK
jgi:hypothetical protein